MTFVVTKTSDPVTAQIKTFNTLQELINFQKRQKCGIIINKNISYNESIEDCMEDYQVSEEVAKQIVSIEYEIEIYDAWRE